MYRRGAFVLAGLGAHAVYIEYENLQHKQRVRDMNERDKLDPLVLENLNNGDLVNTLSSSEVSSFCLANTL